MKFPTWLYKDGKFNTPGPRLVHNAKECLLALEAGYWSHRYKKEEIPGLFKAEIQEAKNIEKENNIFERVEIEPILTPQQKATITRKKNKSNKNTTEVK